MTVKIWLSILGMAVLVGCSSSPPVSDESPELVGAPPPPEEDPFFFSTMPADAVEAEASGSIGAGSAVEADAAPQVDPLSGPDSQEPGSFRCLSCVRICGSSGGECNQDDDAICGWGVHPGRDSAANLARAQCEGALEEARGSARFRSIEGACPAATCERP